MTPESPETGPESPRIDAWWEITISVCPVTVGAFGDAVATFTMPLPHRHAMEALNDVTTRINPPWHKVRFVSPERRLLDTILSAHTVELTDDEPGDHRPALLMDGAYIPFDRDLLDLARQVIREPNDER